MNPGKFFLINLVHNFLFELFCNSPFCGIIRKKEKSTQQAKFDRQKLAGYSTKT